MDRQILRDKNGNCIGEIETDSNGVLIARDVNGNRVGTYEPRNNTTYDRNSRRIGEGNLLASLVVPQKHDPLLWGVGGYLLGRMVSNTASEQPDSQETHSEYQQDDIHEQFLRKEKEEREEQRAKEAQKYDPQVAVVKWGDRIEDVFRFAELWGGFQTFTSAEAWIICKIDFREKAWVLWISEGWQEEIEDDYHLTKIQKQSLCKLLNKRRTKILEELQSKGNCQDPEKSKIREENYREKMAGVLQYLKEAGKAGILQYLKEVGKKDDSRDITGLDQKRRFFSEKQARQDISYYDEMKGTLKYEFDLTEAQRLELYKLIDWYKEEVGKIEDFIEIDIEKNSARNGNHSTRVKVVIGFICFIVLYFLFFIVYFKIFRKG